MGRTVRKFTARDWTTITGRGNVAYIDKDQLPLDLWDPAKMTGEEVVIDGVNYKVLGVETFAVPRSPEYPYNYGFGLLVGFT